MPWGWTCRVGSLHGLAVGAWGAVQATVGRPGHCPGRRRTRRVLEPGHPWRAGRRAWRHTATGYSFVYHLELYLMFATLVAIGPLVRRGRQLPVSSAHQVWTGGTSWLMRQPCTQPAFLDRLSNLLEESVHGNTEPSPPYLDVAQLTLYAFWIFFAGLIYYLAKENQREGYPLDHGQLAAASRSRAGPCPYRSPRTFLLQDGTRPSARSQLQGVASRCSTPSPCGQLPRRAAGAHGQQAHAGRRGPRRLGRPL
jgi:hypothetical protein